MDVHPERFEEYAIFAIDGGERDDIAGNRKRRWFEACCREAEIGVKQVCGCYEGALERAYVVNAAHLPLLAGWYANQSTVLILSDCIEGTAIRQATLRNVADGVEAYLGTWRAVPEEIAHKSRSWTYDPTTGQHWVAQRPQGRGIWA